MAIYAKKRTNKDRHVWDGYHHLGGMHWGWWIFGIILIVAVVWMFARNRWNR